MWLQMKDKMQKDLSIGDRVVFNPPRYKGLVFGRVVGFAPKMARIKYNGGETSVFYSDVVKVEERVLTLEERRKLLFEFHWPKKQFPDKVYTSAGTEAECDYYNIPKVQYP